MASAASDAFFDWYNYVVKEWQPTEPRDAKLQLMGFAVLLASYGDFGRNVYPSALELAKRAGVSRDTVKRRLRPKVIEYGLFSLTGASVGRVQVLTIAIPAKPEKALQHTGTQGYGCPACVTYISAGNEPAQMAAEHWTSLRGASQHL